VELAVITSPFRHVLSFPEPWRGGVFESEIAGEKACALQSSRRWLMNEIDSRKKGIRRQIANVYVKPATGPVLSGYSHPYEDERGQAHGAAPNRFRKF